VSDLWINLPAYLLVSRSIRTGAKPITELVPIHIAAALNRILRPTGLRAACQSALSFQRNALYHAAVLIGLSQAARARVEAENGSLSDGPSDTKTKHMSQIQAKQDPAILSRDNSPKLQFTKYDFIKTPAAHPPTKDGHRPDPRQSAHQESADVNPARLRENPTAQVHHQVSNTVL
jgi:hypothetical protein